MHCRLCSALLKEAQPVGGERHQGQPGAMNVPSSVAALTSCNTEHITLKGQMRSPTLDCTK